MKNWEIKKLGDVCKFIGGSQPPKSHFTFEKKEEYIRLIQIRDYKSDKNIVYIPKDKAKRFCDENDIMIGRYGPPVFQILKGLNGAYNVALMKAIPNEKVLSKDYAFLFLKFSKIQDYIIHLSQRAAGQTGVNKEAIEDYPILIPPLIEQQRIVSILDDAFIAIDKAKANAEQNLKNAKELFESYLRGVFIEKGKDWQAKRFDEICVLQRGFDLPTHSRNEGSYPLVSSNGITDRIDLCKVKSPGVVTGRSGTIGNVHFIEEDYWPLNTALYIKEFHGNNERFIYFFLKQFDLGKYSSGAGVPTLNRNNVHSEIVWFPLSIKEQQTIVQKLDALSTETKKLEAIYQKKINDLEELKKSVLQKAFSGELRQ